MLEVGGCIVVREVDRFARCVPQVMKSDLVFKRRHRESEHPTRPRYGSTGLNPTRYEPPRCDPLDPRVPAPMLPGG